MSGALKVKMPDGTWVVVPTTGPQGPPGPAGADGVGASQEWTALDPVTGLPGAVMSGPVATFPSLVIEESGGQLYLYQRINGQHLRVDDTTGELKLIDTIDRLIYPTGGAAGSVLTQVATDGQPAQYLPVAVAASDAALMTAHQETHDRRYVNNAGITCATQIMRLTYLTIRKTVSVSGIRVNVGNTPMSGTAPTTIQVALFQEQPDRSLTRVRISANSPGLFTVANTAVTIALDSSIAVVAGQRYACALLVVGTGTLATYCGVAGSLNTEMHLAPRMVAQRTGVPTMPSGITDAQLNAAPTGNSMYFALVEN